MNELEVESFVNFSIVGWGFRSRITAQINLINFNLDRSIKKPRAQIFFAKPTRVDMTFSDSMIVLDQKITRDKILTVEFILKDKGHIIVEAESSSLLLY